MEQRTFLQEITEMKNDNNTLDGLEVILKFGYKTYHCIWDEQENCFYADDNGNYLYFDEFDYSELTGWVFL